jgi:biopolymer transport protein ExbD
MARAKLPRKSTNVDMTAMCDVAFLLLSFFILATKFKPPEVLTVATPESVFTKVAPDKDVVMITIDKLGKVYFSVSDANTSQKADIISSLNTQKNLGLTDKEQQNFSRNPTAYVGVPFSQLKSYLDANADQQKALSTRLPGIPVKDSTDNELIDWMRASATAFQGGHMNILVKGDNESKYPSFQGVIAAFKKNDLMKFQMITNPVAVPAGSELYKENMNKGGKGVRS